MHNPKFRLKLEVGKLPISVELEDKNIRDEFLSIYAPFITRRKSVYRIAVNMRKKSRESSTGDGISFSFARGIYQVKSTEFSFRFDVRKRQGRVDMHTLWPREILNSAFANISKFLILRRGGMVFHGCGVVRNNQAYIFTGPAEAGKSTVARTSRKSTILSQELIGVDFLGRDIKAFALPNLDDKEFPFRTNASFKIAGLFKLVKDRRNYLKAIPKSQALADFLVLPYGFRNLISFSAYFNGYSRLIESVPCYELHFLPDGSFWRCIDGLVN